MHIAPETRNKEPAQGGGSMASTQRKPKPARDDSTKITRVGEGRYAKAKLVEPTQSGYILISAEVDRRLGFLPNSRKKRRLIAECKQLCRQLAQDPSILEAVVFDANLHYAGRRQGVPRETATRRAIPRLRPQRLDRDLKPKSSRRS
jgi:hypothetical protein